MESWQRQVLHLIANQWSSSQGMQRFESSTLRQFEESKLGRSEAPLEADAYRKVSGQTPVLSAMEELGIWKAHPVVQCRYATI